MNTTPPAEPMPTLAPITTQLAKIEELPVQAEPSPTATPEQTRNLSVGQALDAAYQKASELRLTPDEDAALSAPFGDDAVEIRPHDGLLWIPHIHISRRLSTVLGRGQWSLICRRYWMDGDAQQVYADCVMMIRGCFVGESIGAQQFQPRNARMNYSDAIEAAQSEALRRIAGKRLNCGDQVWDPGFCREWCAKYAVQQNGKWSRKRHQDAPTPKTVHPKPENAPASHSEPKNAVPAQHEATEKTREWMIKELAPVADRALEVFRSWDWLMPNEGLADLPLRYVPTTRAAMATLLGEISKADEPKQPPPPESDNDGGSDDWRSFKVPFGNDKGTPLDELDKKKLFGWWANFEVKDVDEDGNPRKPEWIESDQEFRDALDEAGHHYNFK